MRGSDNDSRKSRASERMSKADMTIQPNVEDLLASIRKAIDGQGARIPERRYSETRPEPAPRPAPSAPPPRSRDFTRAFAGERRSPRYEPLVHPEPPASILSLRRTQTDFDDEWRAPPPPPPEPEPAPREAVSFHHDEPSSYLPAPAPAASRDEPSLLSARASEAAHTAFAHLADSLMSRATGDRSIEDLTRDLLRSMLKEWLDDNLPEMVERLVREEIERVARRGARR